MINLLNEPDVIYITMIKKIIFEFYDINVYIILILYVNYSNFIIIKKKNSRYKSRYSLC